MIHWSWIVFIFVIGFFLFKIISSNKESYSDYNFNLEPLLYTILLIAYVLIWGGIFWW